MIAELMAAASILIPQALPHQAALWADQTQDARIALVGPLGCGKTFGLAVKAALLALADPRVDGMLVVPDYGMFQRVHAREWPEIWQRMGLKTRLIPSPFPRFIWPPPLFSRLWIGSAEHPESLAGPNLGYVLFDEPGQMKSEAWERGSLRARHPKAKVRQVVLGGTPEGINWFADRFNDPEASSRDGVIHRTIRAHGWHPDIASFYRNHLRSTYGYDGSLFDAYARGLFVPLRQGRAYNVFDRSRSVNATEYVSGIPLCLTCDFNVDALRWLVGQEVAGELRVLQEIALPRNARTEDACRAFIGRWSGVHRWPVRVYGDASGKARKTAATRTDWQIIREEIGRHWALEWHVPEGNPPVKERVQTVNYNLAGRGGRTVVIDPSCRELIADMERIAWKPDGCTLDGSDPMRTHASDALGYWFFVAARPRPVSVPRSTRPAQPTRDSIMEAAF